MKLLFIFFGLAFAAIRTFDDSSEATLKNELINGEWIIIFFADWCRACKTYKPRFEQQAAEISSVNFASVNYTNSTRLLSRFRISYLPTLYHVKDGQYREISQEREQLRTFVGDEGWRKIKPLPNWISPFSPLTDALAVIGQFENFIVSGLAQLQEQKTWLIGGSVVIGLALILVLIWFQSLQSAIATQAPAGGAKATKED